MAQRLRRLLHRLLQPVWKLALRHLSVEDPWERFTVTPRLELYGSGVRHDFRHFLDGESAVSVGSLDEILDWLLGCRYESDERLFHEADFWQHPTTFERLRAGDCEDFALWAWRKLIELGYDAELITGRCTPNPMESRHAWVVFRRDGQEYLLEAVGRERERMVRPLAEVRREYIPEFGVGPTCRRFAFTGYLLSVKHHLGLQVELPARRSA